MIIPVFGVCMWCAAAAAERALDCQSRGNRRELSAGRVCGLQWLPACSCSVRARSAMEVPLAPGGAGRDKTGAWLGVAHVGLCAFKGCACLHGCGGCGWAGLHGLAEQGQASGEVST